MRTGWYSVCYVKNPHPAPEDMYGYLYAWAAWWSGEPQGKPWRTPDAVGAIEQSMKVDRIDAEILAEAHIFRALSCRSGAIGTRRLDKSFASAAWREHLGVKPNWRAPTRKSVDPDPAGGDRDPLVSAARYFGARRYWSRASIYALSNACKSVLVQARAPCPKRTKSGVRFDGPTGGWVDTFYASEEEIGAYGAETMRDRDEARMYGWEGCPCCKAGPSAQNRAGRAGVGRVGVATSADIAILGLRGQPTDAEVRRAFKRRALETHPDRGGDAEEFKRVNAAYERLKVR